MSERTSSRMPRFRTDEELPRLLPPILVTTISAEICVWTTLSPCVMLAAVPTYLTASNRICSWSCPAREGDCRGLPAMPELLVRSQIVDPQRILAFSDSGALWVYDLRNSEDDIQIFDQSETRSASSPA